MKLWQRICFYSLLLFIPVLLCSGILMIENNRKMAFDWRLKQAASEQTGISSGLMRYIMLERVRDGISSSGRDGEYIAEFLGGRMNSGGIYLGIRNQEQMLYSNIEVDVSEITENFVMTTISEYKLLETEDKKYLMLTIMIPLKYNELNSIYIVDISEIYADRRHQYQFFLKLLAAVVFLLTGGMYLIARYLTKPLRILTEAVHKIEKGNYTERIEAQMKDEFGKLMESHNCMAQAIEEKVRELEHKNREQQRFVDNFTHELKTPLTAVIGYADLLRSTQCEETEVQELAGHIFKEGKQIEKLSELMMDLTFLSKHSFTLKLCDMEEIILEAEELFKTAAVKAGQRLISELTSEPVMFLGVKELIIHLIGNLLDNAKKASQKGDCIWLRGYTQEGCAVLEVADQGKGIPKEDQARIFERFYMVDQVRSGENKGVGLGLSICADIAEVNHARIELTSEVGAGTRVKIIFPCYKQDTLGV